ncbi:zinc uptake regulator, Fur family [Ruaniaceae bacterium KH17]|nr:zinc uptake regulator, Fur family [Ruaniaceae bacterium KH17]
MQRMTRQKAAVRSILDELDGFHSAQEIHEMLAEKGDRVGLATVYRNLQQLAESGDVDVLRMGDEHVYRACEPHHHHHLLCRACGRTAELSEDEVDEWLRAVTTRHGFTMTNHSLELVGLCTDCAKESRT